MTLNVGVLLVGLLFAAVGAALLIRCLKDRKNHTSTVLAEVVNYFEDVSRDDDGKSVTYFPVMKYFANGYWYEKTYRTGSGKKKYRIGELVEIHYDPTNPGEFSIPEDHATLIVAICCTLMGIGVCILAFFAK